MHKYNNQDHSMMTAMCAARNILGAIYDLWAINTEAEYHEEKQEKPATVTEVEPKRPAYAEPPLIPTAARAGQNGDGVVRDESKASAAGGFSA
jgi:hypothetical protein